MAALFGDGAATENLRAYVHARITRHASGHFGYLRAASLHHEQR